MIAVLPVSGISIHIVSHEEETANPVLWADYISLAEQCHGLIAPCMTR